MARVRHDPRQRRAAFWVDVRNTLFTGVFAAAVAYAAAHFWPVEWTEPDAPTRDRIARIGGAILLTLTAWWGVRAIIDGIRWRRARRWERMLDDPERAHLVPPLESHVDAVRSPAGGWALATGTLAAGLAAFGLILYGTLALLGRVEPIKSDGSEQSGSLVWFGALLAVVAFAMFRGFRRWRVEHEVERLSNDAELVAPSAPPAPSGTRTAPDGRPATIAPLEFTFTSSTDRPTSTTKRWSTTSGEPPSVLYLRLFDNADGTERFLRGPWTRFCYVYVLRSASQVTAEELEEAKDTGSVASMFVASAEQLDDALRRQRTGRIDRPRPAKGFIAKWRWTFDSERGRYPVRALLCHGSFWRTAVDLLLERMDFVVIDLCGYLPTHAGTAFELQRVIDRFPIERVTLLAEGASDRRFLTAQVTEMWHSMAPDSPNAGPPARVVDFVVDTVSRVGDQASSS